MIREEILATIKNEINRDELNPNLFSIKLMVDTIDKINNMSDDTAFFVDRNVFAPDVELEDFAWEIFTKCVEKDVFDDEVTGGMVFFNADRWGIDCYFDSDLLYDKMEILEQPKKVFVKSIKVDAAVALINKCYIGLDFDEAEDIVDLIETDELAEAYFKAKEMDEGLAEDIKAFATFKVGEELLGE